MKLASAMRFGGQLVEATACDYNSYKHLGLLCPECKASVFLVRQTKRAIREKLIDVPAHFSHFKQDRESAKVCELRVRNYTQTEIDRATISARNQRLKFFQRWFAKCIKETKISSDKSTFGEIIEGHYQLYYSNPKYREDIEKVYQAVKELLSDKGYLEFQLDILMNSLKDNEFDTNYGYPTETTQQFIEGLRSSIDYAKHKEICREAMQYALTPRCSPFARAICFNAVVRIANRKGSLETVFDVNSRENIIIYLDNFTVAICFVNWAEKFSQLTLNH